MNLKSTLLLTAVMLNVGPLASGSDDEPNAGQIQKPPEWNFDVSDEVYGPAHWKDQKIYEACGGQKQSPIDLPMLNSVEDNDKKISFLDTKSPETLEMMLYNDGRAVVSMVEREENEFQPNEPKFIGAFFSWPSQHTLNGQQFAFEISLVYHDSLINGLENLTDIFFVSILAKIGDANSEIQKFVDQLTNVETAETGHDFEVTIDFQKLFPDSKSLYRYHGSLMWPPCIEIATWHIFQNPITVSNKQVEKFKQLKTTEGTAMEECNRPVQELNGREIEVVAP